MEWSKITKIRPICFSIIENVQSQDQYEVCIEENDRGWSMLVPYIKNGGVNGKSRLHIDCMTVPMELYQMLDTGRFSWKIKMLFGMVVDGEEILCGYNVDIPRVSFERRNVTTFRKDKYSDKMNVKLFDIVIPYKTKIDVRQIEEEND